MTPAQKRVLDFIRSFIAEKGYSPSYEEIGAGVGYSSLATVFKHIHSLIKRGYLKRAPGGSRSLQVAPKRRKKLACQNCGCEVVICTKCASMVAA